MFHHAHIYRLLLVVAHLDFKRFVQIMLVDLQPVIGTAVLACHVERVTGIHTDVLIARSVVDHVLTGKLHLPRLNLSHIARHQLDPRIIKSFPLWLFMVTQPTRSTTSPLSGATML